MPTPEPISALALYTTYHAADEILVLDTVDTTMASTGTNKRITIPSLVSLAGIAPLASPAFTGTPSAPTATGGTNTTQLATTAFVQAALPAVPVTSVLGRTGVVVATSGDYSVGQVTGAAPLASPAFTGTPTGSGAGLTGITEAQINPAAATTVFNSNGSITETYGSGQVVTTVFNSDGSITTTYGAPISHTVTTTFGSTGTITESVA